MLSSGPLAAGPRRRSFLHLIVRHLVLGHLVLGHLVFRHLVLRHRVALHRVLGHAPALGHVVLRHGVRVGLGERRRPERERHTESGGRQGGQDLLCGHGLYPLLLMSTWAAEFCLPHGPYGRSSTAVTVDRTHSLHQSVSAPCTPPLDMVTRAPVGPVVWSGL